MTLARGDRLRAGLEILWFLVLAVSLALDPSVARGAALAILATSAAFQLVEPLVLRPGLRRFLASDMVADALGVGAKLALATALVSYSGGAESRYHLFYYLPVLAAAMAFGWVGTLVTAGLASLSYYSFAFFADPDFQLPFVDRAELALRMVFLFLVATVVNRYVSLERRQRAQLADATHAVERSARLAALGQLSSGLAHEIRNPLGIIQGSAELLEKQADGDRAKELAGMVVSEAKRLNETVTRFLDFARPMAPRLAPCDLREPVRRASALAAEKAKMQGVALSCELPPAELPCLADEAQVQQAILNLALNALQATPSGGTVRIAAVRADGGEISVAVEDSGTGIPADVRERVFDPFFTTRADGTGLGLSIVHKIMDAHGGRVAVASEPGRGAVFTLLFPATAAGGGP